MANQLTFVKTHFDEKANNGLGEWKALFVNGDSDLAKAFKSASAAPGLKARAGNYLSMEQIDQRIGQLKDDPRHKESVSQLEHGKTAITARLTNKPAPVVSALRA